MTVEQLSTSNISSTCPTGVNYISKYAGDLRGKSHEVWTRNSNRSRCTAKKMTGGGGHKGPPNGIRVKSDNSILKSEMMKLNNNVHLIGCLIRFVSRWCCFECFLLLLLHHHHHLLLLLLPLPLIFIKVLTIFQHIFKHFEVINLTKLTVRQIRRKANVSNCDSPYYLSLKILTILLIEKASFEKVFQFNDWVHTMKAEGGLAGRASYWFCFLENNGLWRLFTVIVPFAFCMQLLLDELVINTMKCAQCNVDRMYVYLRTVLKWVCG